ncbi:hypothetical protein OH76DRAFT_1470792 [Lentinus brumalis]|uniref:C2H2-type domain-containing protein n=1 Tax=Lentinus brumalis TaxID=2498619 RepID=A0A371DGL0_9APHY|nr:hypothetical protein OH76DRAFT_1470792 [Polyporus brumalis]
MLSLSLRFVMKAPQTWAWRTPADSRLPATFPSPYPLLLPSYKSEANAPLSRTELPLWSGLQAVGMSDHGHEFFIHTYLTSFIGSWNNVPVCPPAAHTASMSRAPPPFNDESIQELGHVLAEIDMMCFALQPQTDEVPTSAEPVAFTFNDLRGSTPTDSAKTIIPQPSLLPADQYRPQYAPATFNPQVSWTEVPWPQQVTGSFGVPSLAQNTQPQTWSVGLPFCEGQVAVSTGFTNLPMFMTSGGTTPPYTGQDPAACSLGEPCNPVYPALAGALPSYPAPHSSGWVREHHPEPFSVDVESLTIHDTPSPPSSVAPSPPESSSSLAYSLSSSPTSHKYAVGTHARQQPKKPARLVCKWPGCRKKFGRDIDRQRHQTSVHDRAKWICCGFSVNHPRSKDAHLHGDKKKRIIRGDAFVGGCGKTFTRKDTLQRHLKPPSYVQKGGKRERSRRSTCGGLQLCVGDASVMVLQDEPVVCVASFG